MPGRPADRRRLRARADLPAALAALTLLAATAGCEPPAPADERLAPTRGIVLVTLGNLGAAHLGAYGATRPTSPSFDRLARRGTLFEWAISPSPSTLAANVSLVTGLHPQQHGVVSPAKAMAPDLETLAERFATFGYRTAGFTEGGAVSRHFGFHRGFDRFLDPPANGDDGVEDTFGRGLDFARSLAPEERFFLYLHSHSLAAPYRPPPPHDERFRPAATAAFEPTAANLRLVERGVLAADPATAGAFEALYDGGVGYVDGVLGSFFDELERLGLAAETTIVVTSDHGEEFLEHGRLGSSQVYPETARVPLLVLHPGLDGGRRVAELVQLTDLAATLFDLAGLPPSATTAGRSLVPLLAAAPAAPAAAATAGSRSWAFAEAGDGRLQRTLFSRAGGVTHQLVVTTIAGERDGTWITGGAGLELPAAAELAVVSFHRPRRLRLRLDGEDLGDISIGTEWTPLALEAPTGGARSRLDLATDGCDSPRALGLSDDPRCLSFKLRGAEVRLVELFALDRDPAAARDLAGERPELARRLEERLSLLEWSIVAPPVSRPPIAVGANAAALGAAGRLD